MKKLYKKYFKQILFIKMTGMIFIPVILILLPFNFFDKGAITCIYTLLTGQNCYGCGMTRACMRLIHFKFIDAANFNKISFIVFPILCGLYLQELISTYKIFQKEKNK